MLSALFGMLVGLALGLTGGGGSIFAIPLLVYGLNMAPQDAITLSLATVSAVALTGAISAARSNLIEYRVGLIFATLGLLAAPFGVVIANTLDPRLIMVIFALLMMIVAISMWLKASRSPDSASILRATLGLPVSENSGPPCRYSPASSKMRLTAPCSAMLGLTGLLTGILSGLFGVGGGFIIVPALTIITQLSIQRAVATSLFVITLIGASGFAAAMLSDRSFDGAIALPFLGGGIVGMLLGQKIGNYLSGPTLQKVFAALMILVAAVTLLVRH
jgi:uncharacterized protein